MKINNAVKKISKSKDNLWMYRKKYDIFAEHKEVNKMIKIRLKPCCKECSNSQIHIRDSRHSTIVTCDHYKVCGKFNSDGDNRDDFWMVEDSKFLDCEIAEKTNAETIRGTMYCKFEEVEK